MLDGFFGSDLTVSRILYPVHCRDVACNVSTMHRTMTIYLVPQLLAGSCERPVPDAFMRFGVLLLHQRGFAAVMRYRRQRSVAVHWSFRGETQNFASLHPNGHTHIRSRFTFDRLCGTFPGFVGNVRHVSVRSSIMSRPPLAALIVPWLCIDVRSYVST